MSKKRRTHSAEFKFKIALEGAKGVKTIGQIASEHNLNPNQVSAWKKRLLTEGRAIFKSAPAAKSRNERQEKRNCMSRLGA